MGRKRFIDEDLEDFQMHRNDIYTTCNLGVIGGYADGSFHPSGTITMGAFCKTILGFCINNFYSLPISATNAGKLYGDIQTDHVFFTYMSIISQVFDNYSEDAMRMGCYTLPDKDSFSPDKALTQKTAVTWISFFAQKVFDTNIFTTEMTWNQDTLATRAWLSSIYAKVAKLIAENWLRAEKNGCDTMLSQWLSYGIEIDHLSLTPNPRILHHSNLTYSAQTMAICTILNHPGLSVSKHTQEHDFSALKSVYINEVMALFRLYIQLDPLETRMMAYEGSAYQYTSLPALRAMIEVAHKQQQYKFDDLKFNLHMSNAEYLNDPDEGSVFLSAIDWKYKGTDEDESLGNRQLIKPKTSYITCLAIHDEEKLPMWVQYGDGGHGCRIEFQVTSKNNFYQVEYLPTYHKKVKSTNISEKCTFVEQIKNYIEETYSTTENSRLRRLCYTYMDEYLAKLSYYFKDDFYQQEKEIRNVVIRQPKDVDLRTDLRPGELFPKAYTTLAEPLKVTSVTLGPKCVNPEQVALALYQMGIKEVYQSNIHFR